MGRKQKTTKRITVEVTYGKFKYIIVWTICGNVVCCCLDCFSSGLLFLFLFPLVWPGFNHNHHYNKNIGTKCLAEKCFGQFFLLPKSNLNNQKRYITRTNKQTNRPTNYVSMYPETKPPGPEL